MFHITIKNLETEEILHDCDTDAIIGSISYPEKKATAILAFIACNGGQIINSLVCAKQAIKRIENDIPHAVVAMVNAILKEEEKKEEEPDADTNATED